MIKKLRASSKETIIIWSLGVFLVVTFILKLVQGNTIPGIPDLPYDTLYEGGMGFTLLYSVLHKIPNKIKDLGEKMEKNLLGSLRDTYPDFKEELRNRLTKTE